MRLQRQRATLDLRKTRVEFLRIMTPDDSDPGKLVSGVELLASLRSFSADQLRAETPLFAAAGQIALQCGGDCTREFLRCLPDDWSASHLVVDSMLLWLQVGTSLPSQWFHHELFPGRHDHAFGMANSERDVEHIACSFGAPAEREFLIGEISDLPAAGSNNLFCIESEAIPRRHEFLNSHLAAGLLKAVRVPTGQLHRYGFNAFYRTIGTRQAGFHFYIRATRGSRRPIVNGLRNVVSPSFTGPWSASISQ